MDEQKRQQQASQKLREIVARYGRDIVDNPRRLRALLGDLCPGLTRETNVLVSAVDCGVARELAGTPAGQPWELLRGRLTRRLIDQTAIADQAARWAVEALGLALGVAQAAPSPPPLPDWIDDLRQDRTPPPPLSSTVSAPIQPTSAIRPPRKPLRSHRFLTVVLPLALGGFLLGLCVIVFWTWKGRHNSPTDGAVEPTPFDTELALLPGDCQWFVSLDAATVMRGRGGISFEKVMALSQIDEREALEQAALREVFRAFAGKPLDALVRVTAFGEVVEKGVWPAAITLTFASPLDATLVEQHWSKGVTLAGRNLIYPYEKKIIGGRAYWEYSNFAGYLPSAADWPVGAGLRPPPAAESQAARALVCGDHRSIEHLLGPRRSHLPPDGRLTMLLNQTDFREAVGVGWVGQDALRTARRLLIRGVKDEFKMALPLIDEAEEVVGRLNVHEDRLEVILHVTYRNDAGAKQAEDAIKALTLLARGGWQGIGKKEMVAELSNHNETLRPQMEAILDGLEKGFSLTTTRAARTLDVRFRLDRSPGTILNEVSTYLRVYQRETDEKTRKGIGDLTKAAKTYRTKHGSWPDGLGALLDGNEGMLKKEDLRSTWGPWGFKFKYDATGPHNGGRQPDIWLVSDRGDLLCNWDTSRSAPNGPPVDFEVRLTAVSSATGDHYSLPGSGDLLPLGSVKRDPKKERRTVADALKEHTRRHPASHVVRLLLSDRNDTWSGPARQLRYLAHDHGYRVNMQVGGAGN